VSGERINNFVLATEPPMKHLYGVCQAIARLPHVRVSVGILLQRRIPEGEIEYLTVYNADKKSFGNPAGHVHTGESLLQAIAREVSEETNVLPNQYEITGIFRAMLFSPPNNPTLDVVFEGEISESIPSETRIVNDPDVTRARFMTPEEIREQPEFERQIGSTILRMAVDTPRQDPQRILGDITGYFEECGINRSVLG